MGSSFFIDKKLKKNIEKDIKKRTDIEEKIAKLQNQLDVVQKRTKEHLDEFYEQIDDSTVLSTLEYYKKNGNKKKKELVEEIEERFNNSNLLIEDTLNLIDWYEQMCDFLNNKI